MSLDDIKLQWQQLEDWKKLIITLFFSGVLAFLGYKFYLEQILEEKSKVEGEVSKLKNELAFLNRYENPILMKKLEGQIEKLKKQIDEENKKLKLLEKKLPTKPEKERIVAEIYSLADQTNLILNSIRINNPRRVYAILSNNSVRFSTSKQKGAIPLYKLPISTSITGTYYSLLAFFYKLAEEPRIYTVDKVSVRYKGSLLDIDLQLSSYYSGG